MKSHISKMPRFQKFVKVQYIILVPLHAESFSTVFQIRQCFKIGGTDLNIEGNLNIGGPDFKK